MLLLMISTKAHEEEPEELAEEDQEDQEDQEARALEVHGKKEEQERNQIKTNDIHQTKADLYESLYDAE